MAMTEKQLGQVHPSDTNNTTVYTTSGVTAILTAIRICNTDTSDHAIRLFLVPSGGSAGMVSVLTWTLIPVRAVNS